MYLKLWILILKKSMLIAFLLPPSPIVRPIKK